MPPHDQASESATTEVSHRGLLGAVLSDPSLRERFSNLPVDEATIALSTDPVASATIGDGAPGTGGQGPGGQRPGGQSPGNQSPNDDSKLETLELNAAGDASPEASWDSGFVPCRRVATLGDGAHDNVDYRLVGRLGSGGTGIVYQAHQRAIDREVAIKVLRDELVTSQNSRDRFLTEARVIGGLDHPNVIALHEVFVDPTGRLFYSMKRIDGASWDQLIEQKTTRENVEILLDVADAIRYAHSRGLIHRDIKPENVMLGRFGEVLLADWGLAISHGSDEWGEGVNHSIGGTPAYMAPELAVGDHGSISFATDVYLLGAILFQMLTGYPPHDGETLLACIRAAAGNEIRPTSVEGELMDIAMKAMSTDPKDRFSSVDELITAVSDQRQHEQSVRLVRRACERMSTATSDNHYEDYRVADALLMEALSIWPESVHAQCAREKLQSKFAESATARGDLDLAISLYEAAGKADCEAARQVRIERDRRDTHHQRASRYSALFTQSPEAGLLIQVSTGIVVEANEMFGELFGYSDDEVVGRPMPELNLWACPARRAAMVDELKRTGTIDNFEAKFLHTDGHAIDVLISGRIVEMHGEAMVVSSIRDISLRKNAENDLKRNRQRLRDLQSLAGLATWSYDVRTEQVSWSEEAFLLADRHPEQGVPSREEYFQLIHPNDREKLKQSIEHAMESGAAYEVHVRQKGVRGRYREVLVRGQPIFDDQGNTVEIYGVVMPNRPPARA
jgi:PAS domain S-box-containing protein